MKKSPVSIIRFACHYKDLEIGFKAAEWARNKGYKVGINLMQISDRSLNELKFLPKL